MSLLIPSERDYEDAHERPEVEALYQESLADLRVTEPESFKWLFETVPGFFFQADPETDDSTFNYAESNMGRKLPWDQIERQLKTLNSEAEPNVCYKLIICARHGQGFHNQIVDKYGGKAWDEKWHCLGTDGVVNYAPDPMLTEMGLKQAEENNSAWKREIADFGAPLPAKYFASPLQRSCWTHKITWEGIKPSDKETLIVENLRETIGRNLCDKRSTCSEIESRFGPYAFRCEPNFSEHDALFTKERETNTEQAIRVNRFCQSLFESDWDDTTESVNKLEAVRNSYISTTTHAGTIRLFIVVFGHRRFTISTGGMIPILVKGTKRC